MSAKSRPSNKQNILLKIRRQLVFITITSPTYATRHASALLAEVQRAFVGKLADKARASRGEGSLNSDFRPALSKLCARYNDLSKVDALHSTLARRAAFLVRGGLARAFLFRPVACFGVRVRARARAPPSRSLSLSLSLSLGCFRRPRWSR